MRTPILAVICLLPIMAFAAPQRGQNLLANPGFEAVNGVAGAGWTKYGPAAPQYVTDAAHSGKVSLFCQSATPDQIRGAMQEITFDPPLKHPFRFSGWSKSENAGGDDYCIYLDAFHSDGTPLWGIRKNFSPGTHGWEYIEHTFDVTKPIAKIQYFVLFRRATGKVWFDDMSLSLSPFDVQATQLLPSLYGGNSLDYTARLSLPAAWTASVLAGGRTVYSQTGKGAAVSFAWPGTDPTGNLLPGGKYTVRLTAKDDLLGEEITGERIATTVSGAGRGYVAWTDNAMNRILINRLPPATGRVGQTDAGRVGETDTGRVGQTFSLPCRISLARNESESFQVALRTAPATELKDCTVQLTDLQGPGGTRLSRNFIQWRQVGWVNLPALSPAANLPPDALPGWWPDPLLPVTRFTIPPATTQSLWFTVYAPPGTKPGLYRGSLTIRPANGTLLEVPVEATVYNFELPTQGHLKTAFALMDGFLERLYGKPLTAEMRRRYGDFCLQFRLNPDDISRTDPPSIDDLAHYNDRGMNAFNVINMVQPRGDKTWVCWSELDVYTPQFKQSLIMRLDPYLAELKRRGLFDKAYCYTFDERGEDFYPVMKEYFGVMKERWGIPTLTTARVKQDPQAMRDLNVDWNCPVSSAYHFHEAEKCRAAGLQVWSYICCGPRQPYANFLADDNLLEARLIWWQWYQQKMDGFLYWGLNIWDRQSNNYLIDPEKDGPRLKWGITTGGDDIWLKSLSGDGELLYAGKDGPIGCIRLANIRDGLDDYEYLYLLAKLKSLESARTACNPVTTSLITYTRDPQVLLKQRDTIAREIERLQRR